MLENPQQAILSAATDSLVKRYAPPNQRNRSSNRRKSADRIDRTNSLGNDLEKSQVASSRNVPVTDHGDAGWTAAMQSYNNPKDSPEKPVMHMGGSSAWTQFRLPHQILAAAPSISSSGSQLDFLGELRRQMHGAHGLFN